MTMAQQNKTGGNAAEYYGCFLGEKVRIFYQDLRGTNRSLIGTITDCDGDFLWLENGDWHGVLNCANAKITIISAVDGWSHTTNESNEEGNN